MMRSLYSGVSGLRTHQTKMDVIGNNIANVNTTSYKSSSIVFSELMSQTTQKASSPNAANGTGGINARQIGLGVKSGAINTNISGQGSTQSTGNPFDVMINGSAFFVVSDGTENYFTRDGSFYVDGVGNLAMTSTGYNVMGWGVDEATGEIKADTVSALRIMNSANMTYPPEATTLAYVSGVMDKNDKNVTSAAGKVINLNFYDSLGYSYTGKFTFKQSDVTHQYSLEFTKLIDSAGKELDISAVEFGSKGREQERKATVGFDSGAYSWNGTTLMEGTEVAADLTKLFDTNGNLLDGATEFDVPDGTGGTKQMTVQEALDNIAKAHGYGGSTKEFLNLYKDVETTVNGTTTTNRYSMQQMLYNLSQGVDATDPSKFPQLDAKNTSFEVDGRRYDGTTITYNPDTGDFAGIGGVTTQGTVVLGLTALGGNFKDITIDFSESSMLDNKGTSTINATSGDEDGLGTGRRLGDMINISIQNNGMIYASYDNGMSKLLGQIATAQFANASGLEKKGDNLYGATLNSGDFDGVGTDITSDGGYMTSGQLEMSNVDLSSEFTEMITTQRGFQANSRIITVSDTLLEELTNLKR